MPYLAVADRDFDRQDWDDETDEPIEEERDRLAGSRRLLIITLAAGCAALAISNVVLATRLTQLRAALGERPAITRAPETALGPAPVIPEPPAPAASIATPATPRAEGDLPPQTAPRVAAPPDAAAAAVPERRPEPVPAPAPARAAAPAPEPAPARATAPAQAATPAPSSAQAAAAAPPQAAAPPPAQAAAPVAAATRPPVELPPRAARRGPPRIAATAATAERADPAPSTRESGTAAWMVQEYGRQEAEDRARAVVDFYEAQSPEREYWRRVLGEIVTADR